MPYFGIRLKAVWASSPVLPCVCRSFMLPLNMLKRASFETGIYVFSISNRPRDVADGCHVHGEQQRCDARNEIRSEGSYPSLSPSLCDIPRSLSHLAPLNPKP